MAKYKQITKLLDQRIRYGDYILRDFPTDRDLARELGASKITVRKAVQSLIDKGLLTRSSNGRPIVQRSQQEDKTNLYIALLTVSYPSPVLERWHQVVGPLVEEKNWAMRTIGFTHPNDPVIQQTLDRFDGIFFVPSSEEPPQILIDTLKQSANPVVILGEDWSPWDLRSLWLTPPNGVQSLLHHLENLGHRKIVCLNTEPTAQVITQRIEQWQLWMSAYGESAELINKPVKPFDSSIDKAYRVIKEKLENNSLDASGVYCTSGGAAQGAYRAFYESGIEIGKDIAICSAIDHGATAPYWTPSLTSLSEPEAKPYLDICLDWFAQGGKNWRGPMLIEPRNVPLFKGESTQAKGSHREPYDISTAPSVNAFAEGALT